AMIDISDGLSSELHHLCDASGVGCRVLGSKVPVPQELSEVARVLGIDPLDLALSSGEEYELLFTASTTFENTIGAVEIGEITEGDVRILVRNDGAIPLPRQGYPHFP